MRQCTRSHVALTIAAALMGASARAFACDVHPSAGLGATSPTGSTEPSSPPSLAGSGGSGLDVPPLNSLSGAHAKIYLDFDGDFTPTWHGHAPGQTPAYSIDPDTSSFSAQELSNVHEIWSRVSEKFSPFKVNVTTVDPGNRNNRETLHVVIGGDGANGQGGYWLGFRAGGVAWTGGFYTNSSNTAFVFPGNLNNGDPKRVAEASSHESGHGFGLVHQSVYDAQGNQIHEYNPGTPLKAPVMGRSYDAARGLWWQGTTISPIHMQADIPIIANLNTNGFGFRDDDHGNAPAAATGLAPAGDAVSAAGVIERMTDQDYFAFETLAGDVSFFLDVAPFGAMLDSTLSLFDATGQLLGTSETSSLTETLSMTLPGGTYALSVGGAGNYGDVGQYFLTGTIVAVPEPAGATLLGLALLGLTGRRRAVV